LWPLVTLDEALLRDDDPAVRETAAVLIKKILASMEHDIAIAGPAGWKESADIGVRASEVTLLGNVFSWTSDFVSRIQRWGMGETVSAAPSQQRVAHVDPTSAAAGSGRPR
jgi:hypothetical protein